MTTANLYHFNPTCEIAVANGSPTYQASNILQQFESELACLMAFCTNYSNDIVVCNSIPSNDYLDFLKKLGFIVPRFCSLKDISTDEHFGEIIPWGWSPNEHRKFIEIKKRCSETFRQSPISEWKPEHKNLFSRATSLQILESIVEQHEMFIARDKIGCICRTKSDIDKLWQRFDRVVTKTPFSSSGRGVFMMKNSGDFASKIAKAFDEFGFVIGEPLFDKVHDFSLQFEIDKSGITTFKGFSHFNIENGGKYSGQLIGNWQFDEATNRFFASSQADDLICILQSAIERSIFAKIYSGWLGVDCMLVRENGEIKVQPIVEINCRNTMGMLATKIGRCVHPQSKGVFKIYHSPVGFSEEQRSAQITFVDDKISEGKFAAIPMTNLNNFIAEVIVTNK